MVVSPAAPEAEDEVPLVPPAPILSVVLPDVAPVPPDPLASVDEPLEPEPPVPVEFIVVSELVPEESLEPESPQEVIAKANRAMKIVCFIIYFFG